MNELLILRETYPRVSSVLSKQTYAEMMRIPAETLANASLRGIIIHRHCLAYAAGLFMSDVDERYDKYVNCFIEWYDANVKRSLHNSVRLYDDVKRFTGEFDLIAEMNSGEIALIDIKTSCAPSKTWPLQLAAYKHLCLLNGYQVDRVFNLHLRKKNEKKKQKVEAWEEDVNFSVNPKEIDCADIDKCWDIFNGALGCFHYFNGTEV